MNFKNRTGAQLCSVIALLINCDGLKETCTGRNIWHLDRSGSLVHVANCIAIIERHLNKVPNRVPAELLSAIGIALETGVDQAFDKSWYTGIGKLCVRQLFKDCER